MRSVIGWVIFIGRSDSKLNADERSLVYFFIFLFSQKWIHLTNTEAHFADQKFNSGMAYVHNEDKNIVVEICIHESNLFIWL